MPIWMGHRKVSHLHFPCRSRVFIRSTRGNVDWEIWIGVLPRYKGNFARTNSRYQPLLCPRISGFRMRRLQRPNVFLQVNEHFHATTPAEHNRSDECVCVLDSLMDAFQQRSRRRTLFRQSAGGLTVDQGYTDLQKGVADFTVTDGPRLLGHKRVSSPSQTSKPIQCRLCFSGAWLQCWRSGPC